ncbi:aberrant root formation protein 4 isoform X1 [Physcomitrium patens]|uniref:Aberrant root formation protein n=2 Tax=Physcomitrium patens TaxID=3218 RepID=A0A7I4BZ07_PHYPA|nr:aberrant root formation protein 4-like isoform X1 [Physcomitrium patens]XP_024358245.1 aberrant root formation protein 4-like isoform X1 [Physcomitrium patens]|eukprot:XP_024358244.1 aberrant root formation protein 4-like isoform X1 [Physcomitrella patens]
MIDCLRRGFRGDCATAGFFLRYHPSNVFGLGQDEEIEDLKASTQDFLDMLESPLNNLELRKESSANWLAQCEQVLQEAVDLLDPSLPSGLVLCEKIGLELPKVAVKFVSLSQACQDHCLSIIEDLAENCSPREMFAAFMEALNMYTTSETLICCIPLVQGLSIVFSRLKRRQGQFFQEASIGLLALVRLAAQDEGGEEEEETPMETVQGMDGHNVFTLGQVRAAIVNDIVQLAQTVRETCDTVGVVEQREYFQQRLGMFALQILGITGEKVACPGTEVPVSVMELAELLPFCGLSLLRLLTGDQIEDLIETTSDEISEQVNGKNTKKLEASKGAALAVYWTLFNNQVAEAAEVTLKSIKEVLQFSGRRGIVAALSVAASLLTGQSSRPLSSVAAKGLALVDTILELVSSLTYSFDDEEAERWLALVLRIIPTLQRLQNVVVYALNVEMRRQGYAAFKKVIQDVVPEAARLQCLQMLINDCVSPSLVSLHLILIKDEIARAWPPSPQQQKEPIRDANPLRERLHTGAFASPFISNDVLDVIGSVLRPKNGTPPDLPDQIDSVQSALNLYRFILIRESSGKTNHTGILSKEALTMARKQWLLPLREHLGGVSVGLMGEADEMSSAMALAIDNLQSVVYRCLELNEEVFAQL